MYSNCGPELDISAPGSDIWSTLPGNTYGPLSGTSMATPLVSGIAALVLSTNGSLDPVEVRCILTATATETGPAGHDNSFGWGRVNAEAAILASMDPVAAAKDPAKLDTTRGTCPEGIFGTGVAIPVFDPGHAYVDVDNDRLFDVELDVPIARAVIEGGTYVVQDPGQGLVIPPSVGAIAAQNISFRSGAGGQLIIRTGLTTPGSLDLFGGSLLDVDQIQATSGGKMDLASEGRLQAAGAALLANGSLQVHAVDSVHVTDATVTSMQQRVLVTGTDVDAARAIVAGHSAVRISASGDLHLPAARLASSEGNVRLDAGGDMSS